MANRRQLVTGLVCLSCWGVYGGSHGEASVAHESCVRLPLGLIAMDAYADNPRRQRDVARSSLTPETRKDTIERIARILETTYVFPDVGRKMSDMLRNKLVAGEYDSQSTYDALAKRLTRELRAISQDRHVGVVPGHLLNTDQSEGKDEDWWAMTPAQNYGFEKVERLNGNVGYVRFSQFHPSADAEGVAAAAMNFIANSGAVIIDLRGNGGGSKEMISFLSGYLLDEPIHLCSFFDRKDDKTTEVWSRANVPGLRFGASKPVYILTSRRTFSAAEEFAYNLKNLKRAIIVGETTAGGAHPVTTERINGALGLIVPYARAISPITKTNWQGVGVKPHTKVQAAQALSVAYKAALKRIIKTETDDARVQEAKKALQEIDQGK